MFNDAKKKIIYDALIPLPPVAFALQSVSIAVYMVGYAEFL